MNPQTNTKKVWNKIKRIEKTCTKNNIPVLEHNGIDTITDKDKAEAFADSFTKISSTTNYCPSFINIKTKAENDFLINSNNDSVINEPLNIDELNHAIDSSKCTTPGKDGVSNGVIKHLPIKTRQYLLIIFFKPVRVGCRLNLQFFFHLPIGIPFFVSLAVTLCGMTCMQVFLGVHGVMVRWPRTKGTA